MKKKHLAQCIRLMHSYELSIVPLLGFMSAKETEVANIRAIARGKASGIPENEIMEWIVV